MNIVIPCLNKYALFCVRVWSVNHFIICTEIDLTIQIETWLPVASMQGMFIIQHKTRYCYYFLMWIVLNTCTFSNILDCRYIFIRKYISMFLYKSENCELSVSICEELRYVLILWNACFFCSLFIVVILNNSSK